MNIQHEGADSFDDRFDRLYEAGLHGIWAVNTDTVNLDDLLSSSAHVGAIVRCSDVNDIRFIPTDSKGVEGCIAGWISEGV